MVSTDELLERISDAFYAVDTAWRFTYVNSGAEAFWGRKREALLGRVMWDLFPEPEKTESYRMHQLAARERRPVSFETFSPTLKHWVGVRIYPSESGLSVLCCDITERKAAESALREEESTLRSVLESSRDVAYRRDLRRNRYDYLGPAVDEVVGVPRDRLEEVSTEWLLDRIHPEDREQVRKVIAEERPPRRGAIEFRIRGDDGRYRWVSDHYTVLVDADGVPLYRTGIVRDVTAKKAAEEALRESEKRLKSFLEQLPVGAGMLGADGSWLLRNEQLARLTPGAIPSLNPEEQKRWRSWDEAGRLVEPSNWPGARVMRGETVPSMQFLRTMENGTERWIEVRATPYRGEDGELVGAIMVAEDVTLRKQAEEALRAAEERQSFLLELSDALRPLSEPDRIEAEAARVLGEHLGVGRVAYADVEEEEVFIVKRDYTSTLPSARGRHPMAPFGPRLLAQYRAGRTDVEADVQGNPELSADEKSAFAEMQTRAHIGVPLVKGGELVAGLLVHHGAPRTWTPIEVRLVEETAERTWAAVQRARAEEAVRASESRYRRLFDSIDESFVVIEMIYDDTGAPVDYRFTEANPAFRELTKLPDPVGRTARELFPDLERGWIERYGQVAATGKAKRFTQHGRMMDRWFDAYAFRAGAPEDHRVAILASDITERRRHEQALRAARSAAEQASLAKSQFLSTMSHELRTPLNAVVGLADLMETGVLGPMNDAQRQHLARIKQNAWHLVRIIDEILTFSRGEAGEEEVRVEPMDFAGVARDVVRMLKTTAVDPRHELRLVGAAEPVPGTTDQAKVAQILTNLVGNALKFSDAGLIEVELVAEPDRVELRVRDQGPGIPPDKLEEIFSPFFQLDATATREHGGTGLGLTVSRRLARLLGGDVTVQSEPGKGSTFTVSLPRTPPPVE